MRYAIMQRTPFPGYWELMPSYQLQEAEFKLMLAQKHYHERATAIGTYKANSPVSQLLLYSWNDANQIIEYWRSKRQYAEFMLIGYWGTEK